MLPFLEPKRITSSIIARRGKPDLESSPEVEAPGQEVHPALKSAAEDILSAIEHKSVIDLAKAIQSAYDVCESYEDEDSDNSSMEDEGE